MNKYLKISNTVVFALCLSFGACQPDDQKSPLGFDLTKPGKFTMPKELLEISGICFYKGNPDTVYAIQDEDGVIYRLFGDFKNAVENKFGKKGDYEDVALVKETIYVLKSNGSIFSFARTAAGNRIIGIVKEWKGLIPEGEYEGMYGDDTGDKLYILCKNCKDDKKKVSIFIIDIKDQLVMHSRISIEEKNIREITKKLQGDFRPSALSQDALTGDWFIISGVNRLLVVTNGNWKTKGVFHLNGKIFNQPEGIAFDKDGHLYISNEGDKSEYGNILKFIRRK